MVLLVIGGGVAMVIFRASAEEKFKGLEDRLDQAASKARVDGLEQKVNHIHECIERTRDELSKQIDGLRRESSERDTRLWTRIDSLGDMLANLAGQWSGVVLERTAQTARPKGGGQT